MGRVYRGAGGDAAKHLRRKNQASVWIQNKQMCSRHERGDGAARE